MKRKIVLCAKLALSSTLVFVLSCANESENAACLASVQSRTFVTDAATSGPIKFSACAQKKADAVCSTVFTGDQLRKFSTTDLNQMLPLPQSGRSFAISPDQTAQQYYVRLNIGSQGVLALIDTGSSNVIIDPNDLEPDPQKYIDQSFYVSYASGSGIVRKYADTIALNCSDTPFPYTVGIIAPGQNLAVSILGMAYPSIALPGFPQTPITPFFDQVVSQNKSSIIDMFGMALCGHKNGDTVVLGGPHPSVNQSDLTYVPIIKKSYYPIDARSMIVRDWDRVGTSWIMKPGAETLIGDFPILQPDGNGVATIVDSGSTFNYFPTAMYNSVVELLKAASNIQSLGIPDGFWTAKINTAEYAIPITHTVIAKLPKFQIVVRGTHGEFVHLDLLPDTYLKQLDKSLDKRTATFRKGNSLLNILGQAFMEGYYIEFDRVSEPNRIGFASNSTICTGI